MKKIIKNILIILKKFKFIKYFWIFGIFLFMLTNFYSTSLLTDSSINAKSDVSNKEIKDLFEKNVGKKELIYKFLDEFKKEKEIEVLTSGEIGFYSSIQSLGNNKYLVGTRHKGFWFLKFNDNGLVVQVNKIQDKNGVDVPELTTDGGVGLGSSIQSLKNNKYLVGTYNKGFYLLEFDDNGLVVQANRIQDKNGSDVLELTTNDDVGAFSSIQNLGNNKYLVGTGTNGFWLLEFNDNTNKFSITNKIKGAHNVDVLVLTTDGGVGLGSSIQSLKNNKYLVGTGTKGFWLLKFDDDGLVVQANKIKDKDGDVSVLTSGEVGAGSLIESLGKNKYLVGTNKQGFWFLKFDNNGLVVQANKIQDKNGGDVPVLTTDNDLGLFSSIQSLRYNKYLIGTHGEGFWLLKFDNDGLVVQANKIQGDGVDVLKLTDHDVGWGSSIQKLGDTNKYLVGTYNRGFWLLEFNDNGLVVQANKIKEIKKVTNDEFDGIYDEKTEELKRDYKELQILSNFESDDKTFWKEFVMKTFDIDEENKKAKIVDNYSFNKNEIWTEEKLEKFMELLVEEKDNSWKRWLWFLIIIPIILIVIYLLILFIKKNRKRIINNNKKNKKK